MRHMGVAALYPKRRTSAPGRGHKVYPYLLTGVSVERANQVWATDICYLPMAKGLQTSSLRRLMSSSGPPLCAAVERVAMADDAS